MNTTATPITPATPTLPEALSLCSRRLADKQTETPLNQLRSLQTATLLCDVFAQTFAQQPIEATAADFLGASLWLRDWYNATSDQMSETQSSLILTTERPATQPPTAQFAEGFRSLAATWQAVAQAMAEVLPGESVTATIPGALRIWTATTAALVGGATSGTDRRQVVVLTALLRQVSGEAAALAMGYGREEAEADVPSPLIGG